MNFFDLFKLGSLHLTTVTFIFAIIIILIIIFFILFSKRIKKDSTLNKSLVDKVNEHNEKEYEKQGINTEPILEPEDGVRNHVQKIIKLLTNWLWLVLLLWILFSSFSYNMVPEYKIATITIILPLLFKCSLTTFGNLKSLLDTLKYLIKVF